MSQWVDVCVRFGFYMGARVGWRAGEAWARGEDESAIEHHQIKRYLMPALTRPARKQVHSLSTESTAVLLPAKTLFADAVSWACTSEQRNGFQLHFKEPSGVSAHFLSTNLMTFKTFFNNSKRKKKCCICGKKGLEQRHARLKKSASAATLEQNLTHLILRHNNM